MKICVVGLGYVGLPLLLELEKSFDVCGFDVDSERIDSLRKANDKNNEFSDGQLESICDRLCDDISACAEANVYIITVPTPINVDKTPDLTCIVSATETVSKVIKKDNIVVCESTVYPGVTEEFIAPIIEMRTGLKYNEEFFMGYSPERVNPGDTVRTIDKITKVVSASTPRTLEKLVTIYSAVTSGGIHRAASIKVAEAAKVIENTQRDLNIALMNELHKIFSATGIDTQEVLRAAGTKWNFHDYTPGLVGGHCIGVDPYYLTHFAEKSGLKADVILAGRNINDEMHEYYGEAVSRYFENSSVAKGKIIRILIAGCAFKENCSDVRNSKVIDLANYLSLGGFSITIIDTRVEKRPKGLKGEVGFYNDFSSINSKSFDGVLLAVPHQEFLDVSIWEQLISGEGRIFDLKSALDRTAEVIRI